MECELAATTPLLDVRDLRVEFNTDAGNIYAVDGVSLQVHTGQTVAIVGESGCGKSVTALSIMRLIPQPPGRITSGNILLSTGAHTTNLLTLSDRDICGIRGNRIGMVFQEPFASFNPVYKVGAQIVEAIELHQPLRGKAARAAAIDMLRRVGIPAPAERFRDYPHQMSGGMLQRIMIAMALSCRPALLIADEPTTALDVTIQAQILDLLRTLQAETRMSIIIITHDMGVVARIADYVYVMYAGRIVEHAPTDALFANPLHPYTLGLMRCAPRLSERKPRLAVIPGRLPEPACFPSGCRFHPRCERSAELAGAGDRASVEVASSDGGQVLRSCVEHCREEPSGTPALAELRPGHFVACRETGVS